MIGSSIFEQWGQPQWSRIDIINKAIGGTTTDFWLNYMHDVIDSSVTHLALYCGSNDLNAGLEPRGIIERTLHCCDLLREIRPNMRIAYFSIMKAPQKRSVFPVIDEINRTIQENILPDDIYIDLNDIINSDRKWYIEDGLHLRATTYQKMDQELSATMSSWVNKE